MTDIARVITTSDFPLYMNDKQIAIAVLGRSRAREWPLLIAQIERDYRELPPLYERMGGRFWPEVVEFLRMVNFNDEYNQRNEGDTQIGRTPSTPRFYPPTIPRPRWSR